MDIPLSYQITLLKFRFTHTRTNVLKKCSLDSMVAHMCIAMLKDVF